MRRTSCAVSRAFTGLAMAAALSLPVPAIAAQFDFYIKLPPIEGDSGKGESHRGEIEIQSFSWGATQTSHGAGAGGMGAGKVSVQDISAPSATSGGPRQTSKVEALTIKQGVSAAAATGGVNVAAGDLDGDGRAELSAPRDAASGLATGKRMHKPPILTRPATMGSVTVRGKFPSCTVGTRYPSLELGDRGQRYTLQDVVIARCGGDASSGEALPMEEVSFNYAKIKT